MSHISFCSDVCELPRLWQLFWVKRSPRIKTSTAKLSSHIFRLQASWLNQMESSMGQMSNQWEREGHAKKLARTVMWAHGGLNLHSNSSKEQRAHIKMRVCRVGIGQVGYFISYSPQKNATNSRPYTKAFGRWCELEYFIPWVFEDVFIYFFQD